MFKVRFAGQPAYITPPIAPFPAGPSGFAYNPGTALDPTWKQHFFATSYTGNAANAKVMAFTMTPKGAGFEASPLKQMLQGVLAPGMKIGPDGAIYLTDWMRGWSPNGEGQLWKLDSAAGKNSPVRAAAQALLKENFASRPVPGLVELLRHDDHAGAPEGAVRARPPNGRRLAAAGCRAARRREEPTRPYASVCGLRQLGCAVAAGGPRRSPSSRTAMRRFARRPQADRRRRAAGAGPDRADPAL